VSGRSSIIVHIFLRLVCFNLGEVTSSDHYYQHQENENDHHIQADLVLHLNLVRCATAICAYPTLALSCSLAVVKVFLHRLFANAHTARAVSKRAAWLVCTV